MKKRRLRILPEMTFFNYYRYQSQVRVSWLDAESNCQAQGGHLVSIGSQEENLFIYNWWVSMLRPLDGTFHEVRGYGNITIVSNCI